MLLWVFSNKFNGSLSWLSNLRRSKFAKDSQAGNVESIGYSYCEHLKKYTINALDSLNLSHEKCKDFSDTSKYFGRLRNTMTLAGLFGISGQSSKGKILNSNIQFSSLKSNLKILKCVIRELSFF